MAGGLGFTSGQGTVTPATGSAALTGISSTVSGGTVVGIGGYQASISGSEVSASAGTEVPSLFVALRSRKIGTGAAASQVLIGLPIGSTAGQVAFGSAPRLTSPAITATQGSFASKLFSVAQIGRSITVTPGSVGAPLPWQVGDFALQQGSGQTFNVAGTGPSGFVAGGTYDVDASGTSLPAGTSLSLAGLFSVGTGVAGTRTGVVFGYNEPPAPAPTPAPTPTPTPSPPPPGGTFATITLNPTSAGTFPYWSGIYPLEGQIPSGSTILSSDDSTLRASVISTWPDGSASVAVVSGSKTVAGSPVPITLQAGAPAGGTNLTTARITALVSNVTVNCGALGTASLSTFTSPTLTWWANPQVICAQYRAAVGGDATLEAVISIHAWASPQNRAYVEVTLENCKMNTTTPVAPVNKAYTATVTVTPVSTGTPVTIATVNSSAGPAGTHGPFRAWAATYWVGGNPGGGPRGELEVTHDTASMQAHPLLHQLWKTNAFDLNYYASDAYAPWGLVRLPSAAMGGYGDNDPFFTASLTRPQTHYLATGDKRARRSVIGQGYSYLTYQINYRDVTSGSIPLALSVYPRDMFDDHGFPGDLGEPAWEAAHHPAGGLMAFMCMPSPVFAEVAQKINFWNKCSGWASKPTFGTYYQTRGKAWCMRSCAHALFLTPDAQTNVKTDIRNTLYQGVQTIDAFRTSAYAGYNCVWASNPTDNFFDMRSPQYQGGDILRGFQQSMWEHHYLVFELHKVALGKLLTGSQQTALETLADYVAGEPAREVTESAGGEFRWHYYMPTIGTGEGGAAPGFFPSWGMAMAYWHNADVPPARSGVWNSSGSGNLPEETAYPANPEGSASITRASYYWPALCAAVDRNVPGAAFAWDCVMGNITNIQTWADGYAQDPRWGPWPRTRSKTAPYRYPTTWTMPTLNAGTAVQMPTQADGSHLAGSIAPAGWSATELAYPMFENYGSGIFCENYSDAGAWWVTGTGGHVFGDGGNMFFAAGFDFTTNKWIRLDNANGFAATRKANIVASEEDSDGVLIASNDYVPGVSGMPAPQHMYRNQLYLPRQFGGGNKGALVVMAGSGSVNAGDVTLKFAHKMDLETGRWTHLTSNRWTAVMASQNSFNMIENMSDFDSATGRLYLFPGWFDANTQIPYIDCRSATPKFAWAAQAESITTNVSSQNPIAWIDVGRRLLLIHTGSAGDPGGAQGIWGVSLTGTGGAPTGNAAQLISGGSGIGVSYAQGRWAQNPVDGCWYSYAGDGSNTLKKITPPTGQVPGSLAGTWMYSTVTFTPQGFSMPVRSNLFANNGHYSRFFYVPALRCFAWIAGVQDRVVLISV